MIIQKPNKSTVAPKARTIASLIAISVAVSGCSTINSALQGTMGVVTYPFKKVKQWVYGDDGSSIPQFQSNVPPMPGYSGRDYQPPQQKNFGYTERRRPQYNPPMNQQELYTTPGTSPGYQPYQGFGQAPTPATSYGRATGQQQASPQAYGGGYGGQPQQPYQPRQYQPPQNVQSYGGYPNAKMIRTFEPMSYEVRSIDGDVNPIVIEMNQEQVIEDKEEQARKRQFFHQSGFPLEQFKPENNIVIAESGKKQAFPKLHDVPTGPRSYSPPSEAVNELQELLSIRDAAQQKRDDIVGVRPKMVTNTPALKPAPQPKDDVLLLHTPKKKVIPTLIEPKVKAKKEEKPVSTLKRRLPDGTLVPRNLPSLKRRDDADAVKEQAKVPDMHHQLQSTKSDDKILSHLKVEIPSRAVPQASVRSLPPGSVTHLSDEFLKVRKPSRNANVRLPQSRYTDRK